MGSHHCALQAHLSLFCVRGVSGLMRVRRASRSDRPGYVEEGGINPTLTPALCCPPRPPSSTHLQEAIAAEAWRAALSRAAGEKVLDDPKLLRRSIKREAADKARSAKKWQERVAAQQEAQRARQDK